MKKALITGITGQDGSYLLELLLEKKYDVHGIIRRSSVEGNTQRIKQYVDLDTCHLHYGDLTDASSISSIIGSVKPDEIYNLGAQSHVKISFDSPLYTGDCDALGTTRILDAIKTFGLIDKTRFYQAGTSEMFGKVMEVPQVETTPFYPRSPYGVAKLYSYWITKNYRESYGLFGCTGILFNHESPRRGTNFVTKKITRGLYRIANGLDTHIELGNLDAKRDWGHARDYVEAMWLMLQQDQPDDYVISMNNQHSVKEFVELSCKYFDMDIEWEGEGVNEVGIDRKTGNIVIVINPDFFRPAEVETLLGNSDKARTQLNWTPKFSFEDLVHDMCVNETGV
jgi:GDPmannose 4,6-dehydratase